MKPVSREGLAMLIKSIFLALMIFVSGPAIHASSAVMGYYYVGSAARGYFPENIPTQYLTHIYYAFLDISASGKCQILGETDEQKALSLKALDQFKSLKQRHPHLKTLLSIGGYANSRYFSDVALTEMSRTTFARSCIQLMKDYAFDGIDIDWEKPVAGGHPSNHRRPEDKDNFVALLKTFRQLLPSGALLASVGEVEKQDIANFNVKNAVEHLDWFGVMVYDLCNGSSSLTCHHAGFHSTGRQIPAGNQIVQWYLDEGVPANKIVLGVPFYGYRWKVDKIGDSPMAARTIKDTASPDKSMRYSEIIRSYQGASDFEEWWDEAGQSPMLFSRNRKIVLSYETPRSLKEKAKISRGRGYKGIMIWELSGDDEQSSLLRALAEALGTDRTPRDK